MYTHAQVRHAEAAADHHVLLQIQHVWQRHASTLQATMELCARRSMDAEDDSATSIAQAELVASASALLEGLVRVYFDVRRRIEQRAAQPTADADMDGFGSSAAQAYATGLHTTIAQALHRRPAPLPVMAMPFTTSKAASATESLRLTALDLAWSVDWQRKLAPVLIAWAAAPAPPQLDAQVFNIVTCKSVPTFRQHRCVCHVSLCFKNFVENASTLVRQTCYFVID